ncbi:MAG TPA: efflux RND transporter permease subunit [Leptospiraceae bacterium]|nr:efflux RND transporter permease subunit [Leptospiraceae bacterium]
MVISDTSIRQPVFITMLMLLAVVIGLLAYSAMPVNLLPDISVPYVFVSVPYPGAGPESVADQVAKPIEDQLNTLSGVKHITSNSSEGVATIIVEFDTSVDVNRAEQEVRDKVNAVRPRLPQDVSDPLFQKIDINDAPIITLAIASAGGKSPLELRRLVDDDIVPQLQRVQGVGAVDVSGGQARQINVQMDLNKLKAWQILDQIVQMEEIAGDRCTNVVFMGMGEPMHNYANVMTAAHILHDAKAFGLGAKRITISTAGVIPSIRKFIFEKQPFNFAISLNHPDPEKRKDIMGIDQRFPLKELLLTAREFTKTLGRKITFEYIMIPDVNMGEKNARLLVKLARSVNCKINLIPLNTEFNGWRRPSEEEMEEFRNMILPSNVPILNRRSPGKDIDGACGMLSLKTKN